MADMKAVTVAAFVEAWQSSATLNECAGRLGVDAKACGQRASWLRGKGVRLKFMQTGAASTLDVEALNALAARHGPLSTPRERGNGRAARGVPPPAAAGNGEDDEAGTTDGRTLPPLVLPAGARGNTQSATVRRQAVAQYLTVHGPATAGQLRRAANAPAGSMENLLTHPWFSRGEDGYYRVTPECRQQFFDET